VAVDIHHELLVGIVKEVRFVDLGTLSDPLPVPNLVAPATGFAVHTANVMEA
jgi:predicted ATPase